MKISNRLLWKNWHNSLVEILNIFWDNCIENQSILSGDSAKLERVEEIEKKLGYKLPDSFRETVLHFSSKLHIFWEIENDNPLIIVPDEYIGLSCDFGWDIDLLLELNNGIDKNFNNKMIFHRFYDGGILAFDLSDKDSSVIYWKEAKEEESEKTIFLGRNFIDFMNRWIVLGCLGTNYNQISKITSSSGIDSDCIYAKKWRNWLIG